MKPSRYDDANDDAMRVVMLVAVSAIGTLAWLLIAWAVAVFIRWLLA